MDFSEIYSIREWTPMTDVTDRIPTRIQRGLMPVDLNITCMDAVADFFALGTDVGIVFWYNRKTNELQRLKAERLVRISCVKVVDSVEYMVAAGCVTGPVSVFQIQKLPPPDLKLVAPCTRNKPTIRYTIRDLHHSSITSCEWTKNGMFLYSGDRQGVVVLTEFDYQAHISKSMEILNEVYEIVQLSAHCNYLLVCTLYRSIVCQRTHTDNSWRITQVGKADRKQLLDCGGIIVRNSVSFAPFVVCCRPGYRIWIADMDGNVQKTLLFKEAVSRSPVWQIPLLNPKFSSKTIAHDEFAGTANFCRLHRYSGSDSLVATCDDGGKFYILNLETLRVEGMAKGIRKISDMCVRGKEVFILEGERTFMRLAPAPEKPNRTAKIIFNPTMPPPLPLLATNSPDDNGLPVEYEACTESHVNHGQECFEMSLLNEINLNVPVELAVELPRAEQKKRLEVLQEISKMDFDTSILYHSCISTISRGIPKTRTTDTGDARSSMAVDGIVEIGQAAIVDSMFKSIMEPPATIGAAHLEVDHLQSSVTSDCSNDISTLATVSAAKYVHKNNDNARNTLEEWPLPSGSSSRCGGPPSRPESVSVQTTPRKRILSLDEYIYAPSLPRDSTTSSDWEFLGN